MVDIKTIELRKGEYLISTEQKLLDISTIYEFLSKESEWSKNIPLSVVKESINQSLNFGLYKEQMLIGYARVISDYSTIAYLGDVFILKQYRGKGLSKWLMETIINHPNLQNLRRWILLTSTADWLYEKYGFKRIPKPEIYMEKFDPDVYE